MDNAHLYEITTDEVAEEVMKARKKFGPMNSPHEGYGVLLEEVDELWDEIKKRDFDPVKAKKEAIQVAAMAICFATEVCINED